MKIFGKIGLILLLLFLTYENNVGQITGNFDFFSVEHGLSHAYVNVIFQDSRGFLWIGTKNGLNRFDGYNFDVFRQQPADSTSISDNYIRCISEDSYGNLWVGTNNGLNLFDYKTNKFSQFYFNTQKLTHNINNIIYHILIDKNHQLWLKTIESIIEFNDSTNTYKIYKHFYNPYNYNSESNQAFLLKDNKNILWIGTKDGLNEFDPVTKKTNHYSKRYNNPHSLSHNSINSLILDTASQLWIGTANGLNLYIDSTQSFKRFLFEEKKTHAITTIYRENNTLWLGTNNGICKFNPTTKEYTRFNSITNNKATIELGYVTSIYKDISHVYWIGTSRGLIKYNFKKEKFTPYQTNLNITSIFETTDSVLWLGTKTNGIKKIDQKTDNITWYRSTSSAEDEKILSNNVTLIYQDNEKNMWIGSIKGINIIDSLNQIENIKNLYQDLPFKFFTENSINTVFEDTNQRIWIGTNKGLIILDKTKKSSKIIETVQIDTSTIRLKNINFITGIQNKILIGGEGHVFSVSAKDKKHRKYSSILLSDYASELSYLLVNDIEVIDTNILWIATSVGLKKINLSSGVSEVFGETKGLPSNNILGIVKTGKDLWLSTTDGISKFNTETLEVVSYSLNDGLQNYEFNRSANFKNQYGKLYFGGISGYNAFYPDSLVKNKIPPKIAISKVQFSNSYTTSILKIDAKNRVEIPYGNNIVNVYFSALDFNWPMKNNYKYKLTAEEDDSKWINIETQHYVSFANMKPGTYQFEVIGSNNDGIWSNKSAKLTITVLPPLSRTGMAFLFYTVFALIILYLIYNYRTWQLRKSNEEYKEKERVNNQIAKQKEELSLKNKNITDSINYAKRIQMAMLPSVKSFNRILPQSFIFYRPKDIVSGDFYWINENTEKIFVAAVDCTGHGVPGAFMSIIGIELLRKIINTQKLFDPSKVLNVLNQDFADIFKDVENITLRDGMDIAFCSIDKKNLLLEFSGAFNPLYVIRDNTITEIKGDRFSVGIDEDETENQLFKNHVIQLQKDDMIYIFSDGYADQFGGPEGKKYKYRRFRHLLLTIHTLPLDIQKELLNKSIEEWRGDLDQVDDILVIGIKPQFNTHN